MSDPISEARKTLAKNLAYAMRTTLDPELRTDLGVARRCGGGMSYKTVERMRLGTGSSPPNFANIVRVAAAFNLTAWHLLTPQEPNQRPLLSGSEPRISEAQGKSTEIPRRNAKRN